MIFALILGAVAVVDIIVLAKLVYVFRLLKSPDVAEDEKTDDLPSVTICITARNETHAMTQCLERVVATEYPKLEVVVLDDGSRDDTSILIKSFAHSGVRFIGGKPLPDGWLGKNYAQSILAREASGTLVFYMDVDTLIERHTVARAVRVMLSRQDKMLSIVPLRIDRWRTSLVFTTMRHFWVLMRHREDHPRATANAWIIERELLLEEFASNPILPLSMKVETAIAGKLASGYHLILSNPWIGLSYEKKWSSQVETSIRLLYLQCHRKWYRVAGLALVLALALLPYVAVFTYPLAVVLIVLQYAIAYYYLSHIWMRYRLVGALVLPYTLAQEIVLLILSAYRYNFGTITWKGRPIQTTSTDRTKEPAKLTESNS